MASPSGPFDKGNDDTSTTTPPEKWMPSSAWISGRPFEYFKATTKKTSTSPQPGSMPIPEPHSPREDPKIGEITNGVERILFPRMHIPMPSPKIPSKLWGNMESSNPSTFGGTGEESTGNAYGWKEGGNQMPSPELSPGVESSSSEARSTFSWTSSNAWKSVEQVFTSAITFGGESPKMIDFPSPTTEDNIADGGEEVTNPYFIQFYHKIDKEGRPIHIVKILNSNIGEMLQSHTQEQIIDGIIHRLRKLNEDCFPICSEILGRPIETTTVIVDLRNAEIMHLLSIAANRFILAVTQACRQHYPGRLGAMYLVNAPRHFHSAWNQLVRIIGHQTIQKIHCFDDQSQLLAYVDEEALPEELGGTCRCMVGCEKSDAGPWNAERTTSVPAPRPVIETTEGSSAQAVGFALQDIDVHQVRTIVELVLG